MRKEEAGYFLQILSTIIAIGLPLLQFAFFWLPPNIKALYLSKDLFIFSSIITTLVSYMVILVVARNSPFGKFHIPLLRIYGKVYGQDPKVWHKIEVSFETLSKAFIPTVFILGSVFVYLGVSHQPNSSLFNLLSVIQSAVYSLMIILSVFVASEYFSERKYMRENDERRATRALTAINLAKETNAFPEMPNIHLVGVIELPSSFNTYGVDLITYVGINDKYYAINTDTRATSINSVVVVDKKVIDQLSKTEEVKIVPEAQK